MRANAARLLVLALAASLFYYGATPWAATKPLGARIFTTAVERRVNPKVLWIPRRWTDSTRLRIRGRRLDGPGSFRRAERVVSGGQFRRTCSSPAPAAGASPWRAASSPATVVFQAVDRFRPGRPQRGNIGSTDTRLRAAQLVEEDGRDEWLCGARSRTRGGRFQRKSLPTRSMPPRSAALASATAIPKADIGSGPFLTFAGRAPWVRPPFVTRSRNSGALPCQASHRARRR